MTEMAMLLPASFGASRRMNDTHDIRNNLRFRNAQESAKPKDATDEYESFIILLHQIKSKRIEMINSFNECLIFKNMEQ